MSFIQKLEPINIMKIRAEYHKRMGNMFKKIKVLEEKTDMFKSVRDPIDTLLRDSFECLMENEYIDSCGDDDMLDRIRVIKKIRGGDLTGAMEHLLTMDSSPGTDLLEDIHELGEEFEFLIRCRLFLSFQ